MRRILLSIALVTVFSTAAGSLGIYWTEQNGKRVQGANRDGTDVQDILTGLANPIGIDVDSDGGGIYFTDGSSVGTLKRSDLDGSNLQTLATFGDVQGDVELDLGAGHVYWMSTASRVRRVDLDGTNLVETSLTLGTSFGMALDLVADRIFFTEGGGFSRVNRSDLDGSNQQTLLDFTDGLGQPQGIDLDLASGKMYWADPNKSRIQRANLDGTGIEDIVTTGALEPFDVELDLDEGKIYWSDTNKILRADLDGLNVETVVEVPGAKIVGIALAVPEPHVLGLIAMGLGALAWRGRKH